MQRFEQQEPAVVALVRRCVEEFALQPGETLASAAFHAWLRSRRSLFPEIELLAQRAEAESAVAWGRDHVAEHYVGPGGRLRTVWCRRNGR